MQCAIRIAVCLGVAMALSACGGGGGGRRSTPPPPPLAQAGTLQFGAASVTIAEGGSVAILRITRSGGSDGAVSVTVTSANGSANAGEDYTALSTIVTFANADAADKAVTLPVTDDAQGEADETVSVTISSPTGGATLGAIAATTVTISDDDPPTAPVLSVSGQVKQLVFTWASVPAATRYQLLHSADGVTPFMEIGPSLPAGQTSAILDVAVHRQDWRDARYRLDACIANRCSMSAPVGAGAAQPQTIGYFKASNTDEDDIFGNALALSGDGDTLVVSAIGEDSAGGNQDDDTASRTGAVYVVTRSAGSWSQQVYLKASNAEARDVFGWAVALSADGNTLAVAAPDEDSAATGADGDGQTDNNALNAGAVYVFTRSAGAWSQQAYLKASNTGQTDFFGEAIALSADGNTLVVSAPGEDSDATGTDGDGQSDNSASGAGAVYVFTRSGGTWSQQQYLKASNTDAGDFFGSSVALSADGNSLAVGAWQEASAAKDANGDGQDDDSAPGAGAVYVFTRSGQQWLQQAYLKASNTEAGDEFGFTLHLSADGNTLAVSAIAEDSAARGTDGAGQDSNAAISAGAVYVFARSPTQPWSQQAYLKASNAEAGDDFGTAIALSADGGLLAVSAVRESGDVTGVNEEADELNGAPFSAGAVYLFERSTALQWSQRAYVKASNTQPQDRFGEALALSGSGDTLAVGAPEEDSNAIGVDGDGFKDNSAPEAGAVYLY
jgi:trimeric autotransporter adhesin